MAQGALCSAVLCFLPVNKQVHRPLPLSVVPVWTAPLGIWGKTQAEVVLPLRPNDECGASSEVVVRRKPCEPTIHPGYSWLLVTRQLPASLNRVCPIGFRS